MPGAGARETSSWAASSRLTAISRPRQLSVSIAAQSPIDLYGQRRPPGTLSSMVLADLQLSVLLYRRAHLLPSLMTGYGIFCNAVAEPGAGAASRYVTWPSCRRLRLRRPRRIRSGQARHRSLHIYRVLSPRELRHVPSRALAGALPPHGADVTGANSALALRWTEPI